MEMKEKTRIIYSYVLLVLCGCALAYTSWGVSLFIHKPINVQLSLIEPVEYWPVFFLGLLSFTGFFYLQGRPKNIKLAKIYVIVASLWVASELARVLTVPLKPSLFSLDKPWTPYLPFSFLYSTTVNKMMMDIGTELVFVLLLGALMLYLPAMKGSDKFVSAVLWAFVILAYVSIAYTFMAPSELVKYGEMFNHFLRDSNASYSPTTSFFWQKNVYGFFLFMGMLSIMVLNERRRTWFTWPSLLVFAFFNLFAICKTVIVICALLYPAYFFFCLFRSYKKNKVRNSIYLALVSIAIIVFLAIFLPFLNSGTWRSKNLLEALANVIGIGGTTMSLRAEHWLVAISVNDNPFRVLFGFGFIAGEEISLRYQEQWMANDIQRTSHSFWVDVYLRYGALGLLLEAVLMTYLVYLIWRIWKKERWNMAPVLFLVLLAIVVYSLDESKGIFYRDTNSLAFLAVLYFPASVYSFSYADRGLVVEERTKLGQAAEVLRPFYDSRLYSSLYTSKARVIRERKVGDKKEA